MSNFFHVETPKSIKDIDIPALKMKGVNRIKIPHPKSNQAPYLPLIVHNRCFL
jgi:hypothetical protein